MELLSDAHGAVAADGDEGIETEALKVLDHLVGTIHFRHRAVG